MKDLFDLYVLSRTFEFDEVMKAIELFVREPVRSAASSETFDRHWSPPGPWR